MPQRIPTPETALRLSREAARLRGVAEDTAPRATPGRGVHSGAATPHHLLGLQPRCRRDLIVTWAWPCRPISARLGCRECGWPVLGDDCLEHRDMATRVRCASASSSRRWSNGMRIRWVPSGTVTSRSAHLFVQRDHAGRRRTPEIAIDLNVHEVGIRVIGIHMAYHIAFRLWIKAWLCIAFSLWFYIMCWDSLLCQTCVTSAQMSQRKIIVLEEA